MSVDTDVIIDEKIKKQINMPGKYKVIFLNDDATPMEWVIEVLTKIYRHSQNAAEDLTMRIHTEGSSVVGRYSHEVAEIKVHETITASRDRGFPLKVTMEEDR